MFRRPFNRKFLFLRFQNNKIFSSHQEKAHEQNLNFVRVNNWWIKIEMRTLTAETIWWGSTLNNLMLFVVQFQIYIRFFSSLWKSHFLWNHSNSAMCELYDIKRNWGWRKWMKKFCKIFVLRNHLIWWLVTSHVTSENSGWLHVMRHSDAYVTNGHF